MKLRIDSIKTSNLRCPDFDISLKDGVNFLQIPNGVGKTTILQLIKNTLSNNWSEKIVMSLRQKKNIYKDCASYMADEGSFTLEMTIDETHYGFEVNFNFEDGSHNYITKSPTGNDNGYRPPEAVRACLSNEHVDIFCFSADQLKPYFENTDRKVKQTVGTFTGANKLQQIMNIIDDFFNKKFEGDRKTRGSTIKYDEKIKKLDVIIHRLEKKEQKIAEEIEELTPAHTELTSKINDLETKNLEHLERKEELESAVNDLEKKALLLQSDISEKMKNPLFFSKKLSSEFEQFAELVEVNELPGYSAKFFDFLQKQDDCICGRSLNEEHKKEISSNKEKYLAHDDHAMAEQIITHIGNAIKHKENGTKYIEDLGSLENELLSAKQELNDYMEANRKGLGIEKLNTEENLLAGKINTLKSALAEITKSKYDDKRHQTNKVQGYPLKDYDDAFTNIEDAKALRNILRIKRANAGEYKKAFDLMEEFKLALSDSINEANDEIYKAIKTNMNTKIKQVFGTQQIEVEDISNCIKLQGSDDGGSGAENTVSVTSFALALLERSSVRLPMIIDHPVIGVDTSPRKHLSKFLNNLNVQTICFVITSEVPGFIEFGKTGKLHDYLKESNFCTLSRLSKINSVYDPSELPTDMIKTNDGFLSYDRKFFQSFDTEKMQEDE